MIIPFIFAIFISFLFGFFIQSLCWQRSLNFKEFAFVISLSLGLGTGLTSVIFTFFKFLQNNSNAIIFLFEMIFTFFILIYILKRVRIKNIERFIKTDINNIYFMLYFIIIFILIFLYFLISYKYPEGNSDSLSCWNLNAKFIFKSGFKIWKTGDIKFIIYGDYPFLVSSAIARLWLYYSRETSLGPILINGIFTFSIVNAIFYFVSLIKGVKNGVLSIIIFITSFTFLKFSFSQFADIPLSFFSFTSICYLYLYISYKKNNLFLLLSGISASLTIVTKNEGSFFFLSLILSYIIVSIISKRWRFYISKGIFFLLGSLPILLMFLYFKIELAPKNRVILGLLNKGVLQGIMENVFNPERYIKILLSFVSQIKNFLFILPLIAYLIIIGVKAKNQEKLGFGLFAFVIFFLICSYFFIYLITPLDLKTLLGSSLDRLILQIWPIIMVSPFLIIKRNINQEKYLI